MKPNIYIQIWSIFHLFIFFSLLAIGKLSKSLLFQKKYFLIFLFGKTLPGKKLKMLLFEVVLPTNSHSTYLPTYGVRHPCFLSKERDLESKFLEGTYPSIHPFHVCLQQILTPLSPLLFLFFYHPFHSALFRPNQSIY